MIRKAVRDMTESKVMISGKFDNWGSTTNESHWNLLCSSWYAYLYSEIQYLICFLSAGWQWILNLKPPPGICYLSSWKKENCWKECLLGDDTSLVFTFIHSPKLKQLFQNDWCRQAFISYIWMKNNTVYVQSHKNAKFYPGFLICMTIKKHLNVACIPFQSVQNLQRGVCALPLTLLVCYTFQVNPYSWLQSVPSNGFAKSVYSVALYLLVGGENWTTLKTFIATAVWQDILLKFMSVRIQTLKSYR